MAKSKSSNPYLLGLEQARARVASAKDVLKGIEDRAACFHSDRRTSPEMTKVTFFDALFNARDTLAAARIQRATALKDVRNWNKEHRDCKPLVLKRT